MKESALRQESLLVLVIQQLFHGVPAQHIRQSPRRQLGCFYGYGYRAPGNIFINQLHRLLPWDNLSRSAITDPHGLFSAFDGSPPKKNRL